MDTTLQTLDPRPIQPIHQVTEEIASMRLALATEDNLSSWLTLAREVEPLKEEFSLSSEFLLPSSSQRPVKSDQIGGERVAALSQGILRSIEGSLSGENVQEIGSTCGIEL
jgi:hypothetical protein